MRKYGNESYANRRHFHPNPLQGDWTSRAAFVNYAWHTLHEMLCRNNLLIWRYISPIGMSQVLPTAVFRKIESEYMSLVHSL